MSRFPRNAICAAALLCYFLGQIYATNIENDAARKIKNIQLVSHQFAGKPLPESGDFIEVFDDPEYFEQSTGRCAKDLIRITESVTEKWAIQMIDADGKPQSGFMVGNMRWLGDFYECRSVIAPAVNGSGSFKGQYCALTFNIYPNENATASLPVIIGTCIPSTCNGSDVADVINFGFQKITTFIRKWNSTAVINTTASCQQESLPYDNAAIATLCILSLFGVLVLIGTSMTIIETLFTAFEKKNELGYTSAVNHSCGDDEINKDTSMLVFRQPENSFAKDFFKSFCFITNASKIMSTDARNDLRCVHGIRFLSMSWVILGHTYVFSFMGANGNMVEVVKMADTFLFQAIFQGTFSVDSFFVLSGFLLTYLFLKEANEKEGKISWILFYVHRYVRLTPIYALVLAFQTSLAIHLGDGPMWPTGINDPACRDYWWKNLLYINNFGDASKACMSWSWYLANDMQFYVISPLFLYPLWRWPKIGLSIIATLILGSWIATGIISVHYGLPPGYTNLLHLDQAAAITQMGIYFDKLYIKPYTRISTYLIGVILGYFVSLHFEKRQQPPKIFIVFGWCIAAFLGLGIVYGFYHYNFNVNESAAYNAMSRSVFAISLAWVIYACLTGHGGPVNTILSWKSLLPLSRLTYSAYLIHPILMMWFLLSLKMSLQITNNVMVLLYFGYLFMAYVLALACSAIFESSIMGVEKLILKKLKH